jgi:hypothetical protein
LRQLEKAVAELAIRGGQSPDALCDRRGSADARLQMSLVTPPATLMVLAIFAGGVFVTERKRAADAWY